MQDDLGNPTVLPPRARRVPLGEVVVRVAVSLLCAVLGAGFAFVARIGLPMGADSCYEGTSLLICQAAGMMSVIILANLAALTIGIGGIIQAATAGMRATPWWGRMAGLVGVYLVLLFVAFAIAS